MSSARAASVLMLVAPRGHVVQETLPVIDELTRAGVQVVLGTERGGEVRFDPVCNALALAEWAWSPAWRLLRHAQRTRQLADVARPDGYPTDWASRFDALVIPGGHGRDYAAFVRGSLVAETIDAFAAAGKTVGLICHSVAAAALPGPHGRAPLATDRHVTCWPRAAERLLAALPIAGRYFAPFDRYVQDYLEGVTPHVHCSALPWRMPPAMIDGPLVTTWGPWTSRAFGRALAERLSHAGPALAAAERPAHA